VSRSPSAKPKRSASLSGERAVTITHPDKILFPDDGITKGELAAYYESIAPVMLPHLRGRPITMERYPSGIGTKGFWQKSVVKGFPDWLERVDVAKKDGTVRHPLVSDVRSLLWTANQNTITHHVWTSRVPDLHRPDVLVFDLDPSIDEPAMLRDVALSVRDFLGELGLSTLVKTTGSKGFHIVVPIEYAKSAKGTKDARDAKKWDAARFADAVGAFLVKHDPQHLTQEFHKVDRGRRVLMDTGRNHYSATFAAAYTVRAKPGAPVSAPCTWEEIERGTVTPRSFTIRNMAERIETVGDLWADAKPSALRPAMERLRTR